MASQAEIQQFLGKLVNAYPAFEPKDPEGFINLWTTALASYPGQALEQAFNFWMAKGNRFFPSLPEIIVEVIQAASTQGSAYHSVDPLMAEMIALEEAAVHNGLDEDAWVKLSMQFKRRGREYMGETMQRKLARSKSPQVDLGWERL
jgi:hypothetical protein